LRTTAPLRAASLPSAAKEQLAVARGQVMVQQSRVRPFRSIRDDAFPVRRRARHGPPACLCDEVVLRMEMTIEATMGQVGFFHDVGNADAGKALGAKQPACRIEDAFVIYGGFFPADFHYANPIRGAIRFIAQPCHASASDG
jgi:hypothetical protein